MKIMFRVRQKPVVNLLPLPYRPAITAELRPRYEHISPPGLTCRPHVPEKTVDDIL